jgi:hypothetical protein
MNTQSNPLVALILNVAGAAAPGHAGTVALLRTLLAAGVQLREQLARIKAKDPEAYAEVAKEFAEADAGLTAALDRADARGPDARDAGSGSVPT